MDGWIDLHLLDAARRSWLSYGAAGPAVYGPLKGARPEALSSCCARQYHSAAVGSQCTLSSYMHGPVKPAEDGPSNGLTANSRKHVLDTFILTALDKDIPNGVVARVQPHVCAHVCAHVYTHVYTQRRGRDFRPSSAHALLTAHKSARGSSFRLLVCALYWHR